MKNLLLLGENQIKSDIDIRNKIHYMKRNSSFGPKKWKWSGLLKAERDILSMANRGWNKTMEPFLDI